jgi:rhamnosyltransferase
VEVIVVDSGSSDGTGYIARGLGATVIDIPHESFTFGGSLNTGCEAASAPLLLALSAHAFPPDGGWLARMRDAFADPLVACAYGCPNAPDGGELRERVVQDEALARRYPHWGYGNPAGAFRADLWRKRSFRADMPGTEDKEWAWHWLQRGYLSVVDPGLGVDHDHTDEGPRERYRRAHREWLGVGMFADVERRSAASVAREWWSERGGRRSHLRARLSARRAAELAGEYAGRRAATRL